MAGVLIPASRHAVRALKVLASRRLRSSLAAASPRDFKTRDAGVCDPARILDSPDISLYCLDHASGSAIFVDSDCEHIDAAAFLYQAQARHARALISVPFAVLHELANAVSLGSTRLALVYSTGRCGSTLVSRALGGNPFVRSLSEPDAFTNLVSLSIEGRVSGEELRKLLRSCMLLQLAPHICRSSPRLIAVKFRSFVVALAQELHEVFPEAKGVFLYRHAVGYFRSVARILRQHRWDELSAPAPQMLAAMRGLVPLLDEHARVRSEAPSTAEVIACMWASAMQDALKLLRKDTQTLAIRYEDVQEDARSAMRALFSFLEVGGIDEEALDGILREDSQAGSSLGRAGLASRAGRLTDEVVENMLSCLRAVAPRLSPDMRLPSA